MSSLVDLHRVCCCALLLVAFDLQYVPEAEASVASWSTESSSPLSAAGRVVPPDSSSTTVAQSQRLPTVTAASVAPSAVFQAPSATVPHGGPISSVGSVLLSSVPGISGINKLFAPRQPSASQTAQTAVGNENPQAPGNINSDRPGILDTSETPNLTESAKSSALFDIAERAENGTRRLRTRRPQNLQSAAKHVQDQESTEFDEGRTEENPDDTVSGADAEQDISEEFDLPSYAVVESRRVAEAEDSEQAKNEASGTISDGLSLVGGAKPEKHGRRNKTQEPAADESADLETTNAASGEVNTHNAEMASAAASTSDVSGRGVSPSSSQAEGSAQSTDASPHMVATSQTASAGADALRPQQHADSLPDRRLRPRTASFGGGPTFIPPAAVGSSAMQRAVGPYKVGLNSAPMGMLQPVAVGVQPVAVAMQPAAVAVQPTAVVMQPTAVAVQPATVAVQPATVAVQPATVAVQPATVAVQPAAVAVQPTAVAVQPATVTAQPATVAVQQVTPVQVPTSDLVTLAPTLRSTVEAPVAAAPAVAVAPVATTAVATPVADVATPPVTADIPATAAVI